MRKWFSLFLFMPTLVFGQTDEHFSKPTAAESSIDKRWLGSPSNYKVPEEIWLDIKQKNGFLAAHRAVMAHLPDERITGIELSFRKKVGAKKFWHRAYNYPSVGVTLLGSTLGNNELLGQSIGAYSFITFPMNLGNRHIISAKLGCGLGYVNKVFNQETNPLNVAISTHINALICLGIEGRIRLADRHLLLYSFDLTHLSNGATKVPNLGLNMPNIGIGYAYRLKSADKTIENTVAITPRTPFLKGWNTHLVGVLSVKEIFPTGEKKYPVYALSIQQRKRFRPKVGMEAAFDIMSKQAVFGYKRYIPKTQWTILQLGVYVGYVLPLDHLQFVVGMGTYVKDRYNPDGIFYHRVGMRYQFDNGITANLILKSHWAKADYIEYGIGYTFRHTKYKKTADSNDWH